MKVSSLWIALLWLPWAANALTKTTPKTKTKTIKKRRTTAGTKKKKTPSLVSSILGGGNHYLYEKEDNVIEYKSDDEDTDFKQSRMARIV